MYVIKRIDKEHGQFSVTHLLLIDAEAEAVRLAEKHAQETPVFEIYELTAVQTVSAAVKIISEK